MKNLLDVIKLLKRFGIYTYMGNRKEDIDLMQSEIKDLYEGGLLSEDKYLLSLLILRTESMKEISNKQK